MGDEYEEGLGTQEMTPLDVERPAFFHGPRPKLSAGSNEERRRICSSGPFDLVFIVQNNCVVAYKGSQLIEKAQAGNITEAVACQLSTESQPVIVSVDAGAHCLLCVAQAQGRLTFFDLHDVADGKTTALFSCSVTPADEIVDVQWQGGKVLCVAADGKLHSVDARAQKVTCVHNGEGFAASCAAPVAGSSLILVGGESLVFMGGGYEMDPCLWLLDSSSSQKWPVPFTDVPDNYREDLSACVPLGICPVKGQGADQFACIFITKAEEPATLQVVLKLNDDKKGAYLQAASFNEVYVEDQVAQMTAHLLWVPEWNTLFMGVSQSGDIALLCSHNHFVEDSDEHPSGWAVLTPPEGKRLDCPLESNQQSKTFLRGLCTVTTFRGSHEPKNAPPMTGPPVLLLVTSDGKLNIHFCDHVLSTPPPSAPPARGSAPSAAEEAAGFGGLPNFGGAAAPAAAPAAASASGAKTVVQVYRERITTVYTEKNPEKLGEIENLLTKYKGQEHILYLKICKKYQVNAEPEFTEFTVAPSSPSPFGQGLKGVATGNPFGGGGSNTTANPFGGGSTTANPFGSSAPSASSSGGGPFGSASGSASNSPFAASGSSTGSGAASPFGASANPGASPFGLSTGVSPFGASAASGSSPFGSGAASSGGSNPFGSSTAGGSSPFGSGAASGSSPFGAAASSTTSSPFGAAKSGGGIPAATLAASPFAASSTGSSPFATAGTDSGTSGAASPFGSALPSNVTAAGEGTKKEADSEKVLNVPAKAESLAGAAASSSGTSNQSGSAFASSFFGASPESQEKPSTASLEEKKPSLDLSSSAGSASSSSAAPLFSAPSASSGGGLFGGTSLFGGGSASSGTSSSASSAVSSGASSLDNPFAKSLASTTGGLFGGTGLFGGGTGSSGASSVASSSASPSASSVASSAASASATSGTFLAASSGASSSASFGGSSGDSLFGSSAASASKSSPLFGTSVAPSGGSLFGGDLTSAGKSQAASGASLFGSPTASATKSSSGGHLLGTSAASDGTSLFASTASSGQSSGASVVEEYRARITKLYEQHNPSKLGEIENLLTKNAGKEYELYLRICKKYQVTPEPEYKGPTPASGGLFGIGSSSPKASSGSLFSGFGGATSSPKASTSTSPKTGPKSPKSNPDAPLFPMGSLGSALADEVEIATAKPLEKGPSTGKEESKGAFVDLTGTGLDDKIFSKSTATSSSSGGSSGGLFASSAASGGSSGGLFASAASGGSSGGLFGSAAASGGSSGGLFGSAAASGSGPKSSSSAGLFGSASSPASSGGFLESSKEPATGTPKAAGPVPIGKSQSVPVPKATTAASEWGTYPSSTRKDEIKRLQGQTSTLLEELRQCNAPKVLLAEAFDDFEKALKKLEAETCSLSKKPTFEEVQSALTDTTSLAKETEEHLKKVRIDERAAMLSELAQLQAEGMQLYPRLLGPSSDSKVAVDGSSHSVRKRCMDLSTKMNDLEKKVSDQLQKQMNKLPLEKGQKGERAPLALTYSSSENCNPDDDGGYIKAHHILGSPLQPEPIGGGLASPLWSRTHSANPSAVPLLSRPPNPLKNRSRKTGRLKLGEVAQDLSGAHVPRSIGAGGAEDQVEAFTIQCRLRQECVRSERLQDKILELSKKAELAAAKMASKPCSSGPFVSAAAPDVAQPPGNVLRGALHNHLRALARLRPKRRSAKRTDHLALDKGALEMGGEIRPQSEIDTPTFGSRAQSFDSSDKEKGGNLTGDSDALDRLRMPPPSLVPSKKSGGDGVKSADGADTGGALPSFGGSLFSSPSASASSQSGGLFGSGGASASSGGLFAGSLFGDSTPSSSSGGGLFGDSTPSTSSGGGLFAATSAASTGSAAGAASAGITASSASAAPGQSAGASAVEEYRARITKLYEQHNPSKLGEIENLLTKNAGKEYQLYLRICNKYKVPPEPEYKAPTPASGGLFGLGTSAPAQPDLQKLLSFGSSGSTASSGGGLFGAASSGTAPAASSGAGLAGLSASSSGTAPAASSGSSGGFGGLFGSSAGASSGGLFGSSATAGTSGATPSLFGAAAATTPVGSSAPSGFGASAPALSFGTSAQPATTPGASPFGGGSAFGAPAQATTGRTAQEEYRDRITAIYSQHNPSKLSEIPTLLGKYVGNEHTLYVKICNKYKVPQQPQYVPGGASPSAGTPGFGQSTGGFGQSVGGFGQSAGGFGQSAGGFGQSAGGFGQSAGGFGLSSGGFGQSTGGFGAAAPANPFGGSTFGAASSGGFGAPAMASSGGFGGGFGASSGGFGASQGGVANPFGAASAGGFGAGSMASSGGFGGGFGQSAGGFGQSAGGFGAGASPFGGGMGGAMGGSMGAPMGGMPGAMGGAMGGMPGAMGGMPGAGGAPGGKSAFEEYGQRITQIYQQYNPAKLNEIAQLLQKNAGREHGLYLRICNKYKVPPQPEYNPGGAPGMQAGNPFGGGGAAPSNPFGGGLQAAPNPFGGGGAVASPFGGGAQPMGGMPGAMGGAQPMGGGAAPNPFGGGGAAPNPFGGGNPSGAVFGSTSTLGGNPSPFGGAPASAPNPFAAGGAQGGVLGGGAPGGVFGGGVQGGGFAALAQGQGQSPFGGGGFGFGGMNA